ncbi:hypothetical protein CAT24_09090 [Acinetobacter pittii]|uniref:hypothetical protein n=1 Tax=Acinetobacter calcoaceticus/baumannii complex TaxID=909768 RepID=UPI0004480EC5|nr:MULTISPECIES: hypothetical protein [Acinetobacter calcoaceticus/baumannii complex]EXG33059.1 hypothetical protein J733_0923 [Acinetobacter sp. 263903-2]OTS02605.1 hypothetical protein CAT24_09090 [Acinetobacter pittii]
MKSTIDINVTSNMTAEQKLEQVQYPIENLKHALSALNKISEELSTDEHTALFNLIHQQICQIDHAIK